MKIEKVFSGEEITQVKYQVMEVVDWNGKDTQVFESSWTGPSEGSSVENSGSWVLREIQENSGQNIYMT